MITIITGTPGAGKTLYCISKLLLPLVGTSVKQEEDGEVKEYPRTIYTNIKGLLIDHELIDGSDEGGLRNWHEWAKPGSVIVFDEVQKVWTPRANGSAVPEDIKALETHRHMGVDFILITQGLMLTERNLAMLCNRHLHVRRVGNMPVAIVYEWDHASRTLMYSKAFTKSPWRYDKKVFKLYKSADLHTKQKRSAPAVLWFILAGVLGLAVMGPMFKARMAERVSGHQVAAAAPDGKPSGSGGAAASGGDTAAPAEAAKPPIDDAKDWHPRDPLRPESAPAYDALRKVAVMPRLVGCVSAKDRARCYTQQGTVVEVPAGMAVALIERPLFDPYEAAQAGGLPNPPPGGVNAPEARSGPSLVVFDGPGFYDPQGKKASSAVR